MYRNLHCYLDTTALDSPEDLDEHYPKLHALLMMAAQHQVSLHYSRKLLAQLSGSNSYDSRSPPDNLAYILTQQDSHDSQKSYDHVFLICYYREQSYIEVSPYKISPYLQKNTTTALLTLHENSNLTLKPETLLVFDNHPQAHLLKITALTTPTSLAEWIAKNGPPRNFNLSPKHGENGKGNWQGQSVLHCDKNAAQVLLNSAIADFTKLQNRLFNFDDEHNTFIEFFYEGKISLEQWHGFHVDESEWDKRIPDSIRKYYEKK